MKYILQNNDDIQRLSYGSDPYGSVPYGSITEVFTICSWITSKGGWNAITAYDIMLLVDAYLELINLGYTVRMQDINGTIAYYLDILDSGNDFTGCSFT